MLGLLISILTIMAPQAVAQSFGMDEEYQQEVYNSMQGAAQNSSANTGNYANQTSDSAWQDMSYVQNQYAPLGNIQAPIQNSPYGAVSTFKGSSGDWQKGKMKSGQQLPRARTGIQAIRGGYIGPAAGWGGTSGFYNIGGGSRVYPLLPPTSTSSVNLHTAF